MFTEMGRQPWVVVLNPTGDQMIATDGRRRACPATSAGMVLHIADPCSPLLYARTGGGRGSG